MSALPKYSEVAQTADATRPRPSLDSGHGDSFELDNFSDLDSLDYQVEEHLNEFDLEPLNNTAYHQFELALKDKSNLKMAFMNMANSILGAGAIGTPFAMSNTGVVGGALALFVLVLLVDFTLRLIVINMKLSGKTTYQETVDFCFGKTGKVIIIVSQAIFAFGGSIGFCIIIGDTIPHILRSFFPGYINHPFWVFFFSRNFIIVVVTLTVSLPLSLSKDISHLAKASALALVSMSVIILIVLIRGPQMPADLKGSWSLSYLLIRPRIFQGISVISFALVCHHNTSFIYNSLKNPSLNRFSQVCHASCFVSMVAIGLIGFGGFSIFKDQTKGNVLNNFPSDDFAVNIARFCFGLNMLTTFPLEIFVLRDVLVDLYYINESKAPELSRRAHIAFTSFLVLTIMGISLTTCNLGALFELMGATTSSIMAYILPPWCNLVLTRGSKPLKKRLPYYASIIFGFAVMFISSTQTIIKAVNDKGDSHCTV